MENARPTTKRPKHFQTSSGVTSRIFPTSICLICSSPSAARLKKQDRGRRRDDVGNSDDRFLRNLAGAFSRDGKDRRPDQRESERDRKGRPGSARSSRNKTATQIPSDAICAIAMSIKMMPALHDVEAEINQQPRQKHTGHDGPEHYVPHKNEMQIRDARCRTDHGRHYFIAAASRETSASISFT